MTVKPYKTRCDEWRRRNPNDVKSWDTAKGHVVQWGGFRVYYGRCRDCSGLVTTRRNIQRHNWGQTQLGRWPVLCVDCRSLVAEARAERHAERSRKSMAELRRARKAHRDAEFRRLGLPPVRQGVDQGLKPSPDDVVIPSPYDTGPEEYFVDQH